MSLVVVGVMFFGEAVVKEWVMKQRSGLMNCFCCCGRDIGWSLPINIIDLDSVFITDNSRNYDFD